MNSRFSLDLSVFADSQYARQLHNGFLWLRFPSGLERQFWEFHLKQIRGRVRVFFGALPVIYAYQLLSSGAHAREVLRSLSLIPDLIFMLAGVWILWSRWYWKWYLPGVTVAAAVIFSVMSFLIPVNNTGSGEVQVLLFILNVPLFTYLLLGLGFYRGTAINLVCAGVYCVSTLHTDSPTAQVVSSISTVLLATCVAAALAYITERSSRTQFLQERLLGEIAARDGLTGLQNRGAFDEHLEHVWKQAQRAREPVGLLLMDVDHFKGFNDALGHQAGDACLRRVAAILKAYARRPMDSAARYGGEEFAIVFPQALPEQLRETGEAIRVAVEALQIANPAAPRKVVTISCGAAVVIPLSGRSMHGLIQLADEALYIAKGEGRNTVRLSDQDSIDTGRFYNRGRLRAVS